MRNLLLLALALGLATSSSSADAPKSAEPKPAPLPLTKGNSYRQVGLRALEKIANAIDDAGTDCAVLARNLTGLATEVEKATNLLGAQPYVFKMLPMSRALRERQKQQRAFVNRCEKSEPRAKAPIAETIGRIRAHDSEYGGVSPWLYY